MAGVGLQNGPAGVGPAERKDIGLRVVPLKRGVSTTGVPGGAARGLVQLWTRH